MLQSNGVLTLKEAWEPPGGEVRVTWPRSSIKEVQVRLAGSGVRLTWV